MRNVHRSYILLAYFSLMVQGLADNIRGPLFPDILNQFGLDNRYGSLFFSVASGMIIPGGYLGGYLLRRLGRIKSLQYSTGIFILSMIGIWASPTFPWILASIFWFGFSFGIMGVAQNVMVIEAVPAGQEQKWQAGLQSMYGLASLSAPLLVMSVHQISPRWQDSFLVASGLAILLLIGSFWSHEVPETTEKIEATSLESYPKLEMFYYGVILACYVAAEIMVSSRIAQYTRDVEGWSFTSAGTLNSLFFVGLFAGRCLFIFWHPKVSFKLQMLLSLGLAAAGVVVALLIHPAGFAFTGLAMAPFYPIFMTSASRLFKNSLGHVASQGIALTGVTVVAMQTAVGFLADHYGLRVGLFVGPAFCLLAMLMLALYKPLFSRDLP